MRGRKRFPQEKTWDRWYLKNAQRRKNDTKVADTTKEWWYMRMWWLRWYDDYNNRAIIGKKKMQHEKQTEVRLAKRLGFIQQLHFGNLGLNYRDTSTARNRL